VKEEIPKMPDNLPDINWCQLNHATRCPFTEEYSCGIKNQLITIRGREKEKRKLEFAERLWKLSYEDPEQYTKICKKGPSLDFV